MSLFVFLSVNAHAGPFGGGNPFPSKKGLSEAGADLLYLRLDTANDPLTGDLNTGGNKIQLDADGDSYIWHDGSGLVQIYADGVLQAQWPIAAEEYHLLLDDGAGGYKLLLDDGVGGYFLIIK